MTVFRINAVRTEVHLIEAVVRASSSDEAEEAFDVALDDPDGRILDWTEDFGGSETDIEAVEVLPPDHDPHPSPDDRARCLFCGRPFYWSGTPAERSPTGKTMPGPWRHVERPVVNEGVGL
jgi:hypothetical protein